MSIHLHKDVNTLKKKVLYYCSLVEENLTMAISSLKNQDSESTEEVFKTEDRIDRLEIEIEEDCLKILALHQPVAADLRFIIAILKINNDLERIGDMVVNIVERFLQIPHQLDGLTHFQQLTECAGNVKKMLRSGLDSLIDLNAGKAREVQKMDSIVDDFHENFFKNIKTVIKFEPERLDTWLNLLFISKQLERIADHCTNIAEDVIYLIEGDIVRHSRLN